MRPARFIVLPMTCRLRRFVSFRDHTHASMMAHAGMPFAVLVGLLGVAILCVAGCGSLGSRDEAESEKNLNRLLTPPEPPDLVREAAISQGLSSIKVDAVAMVNGLAGTGGAPGPSAFRDMLLQEMKVNNIANPDALLEQTDTALVQVQGLIPPGARRGDWIDVQVLTDPNTSTTDLHGGWLLDTRLRHQQILSGSLRSSDVLAIATGPIITRADYDPTDDDTLPVQGLLLAGAIVQQDRKLGLILRPDYQHVKTANLISKAINRRFYFFDGASRRGIANALEDDFIELDVPPRYRGVEHRLMEVIQRLTLAPESSSTQARLTRLGEQLRDPQSAFDAALQLEAFGETGVPTLKSALESTNAEVRFYAAEALAYLDQREAIEPLIHAIRNEPAFRGPAMLALSRLKHLTVEDALASLFDHPSLETRYGAFVALRRRSTRDRSVGRVRADRIGGVQGESLRDQFRIYEVPSDAPPAVVASLRDVPEIVLFGDTNALQLPRPLLGPAGWILREESDADGIRIARFQANMSDVRSRCDSDLPDLLRAITDIGGGYSDALALLLALKSADAFQDQFAIDPLPESGRTYLREDTPEPSS
ncbi:MAG: flagellar basal body P-ring protein FlgI [Planctomycetota bacterium]